MKHFKQLIFCLFFCGNLVFAQKAQSIEDLGDITSTIGATNFLKDYLKNISDTKMTVSQRIPYINGLISNLMESSVQNYGNIYNDLIPPNQTGAKERDNVEFERYLNTIVTRKAKISINDASEWLYEFGQTPKKDRTTTIYIVKNTDFIYPETSDKRYQQANILACKYILIKQDEPKLIEIKKVLVAPPTAFKLIQSDIDKITVTQQSANFKLEIQTNKGRENVEFFEDEVMELKAKLSAKGLYFVRIIYKLQNDSLTLLSPIERPMVAHNVNDLLEIGKFMCLAPFGAEELMVFASNTPFCKLQTELRNGQYYILDTNLKLNNCSRNMKLLGADVVEDRIKITTKPKM